MNQTEEWEFNLRGYRLPRKPRAELQVNIDLMRAVARLKKCDAKLMVIEAKRMRLHAKAMQRRADEMQKILNHGSAPC